MPHGGDVILDPDGLVTTAQAAKAMGVKPTTIRSWVRKGYLEVAGLTERGRSMYDYQDVVRAENEARKAALRTSGHDVRTRRTFDCAA